MELSGFSPKLRNCPYHDSPPSSSLYQSGYTKGSFDPLSSGVEAPILQVAQSTLRPKSTYSCPLILPTEVLPVAEPSQELEQLLPQSPRQVSLQDEEPSLAQLEHVLPVELLLQDEEQSEHPLPVDPLAQPPEQLPLHELWQLSMQAASQSSQSPHDAKVLIITVGPATKAPSIGNIPFDAFLKNRLRLINSLLSIAVFLR